MSEWRVELIGEEIDLKCAHQAFSRGEPQIIHEEGLYLLRASEFNTKEDAALVRERAKEITNLISNSVFLHYRDARPIRSGQIIMIDDAGKKHYFLFAEGANIQLRGVVAGFLLNKSEAASVEHNAMRIFRTASSNKDIASALSYFSRGDWSNLYKSYELVRDSVENKILSTWVTKKSINRFTQTAQSSEAIGDNARHASKKFKAPANPMSVHEARALIGLLLEHWIDKASKS